MNMRLTISSFMNVFTDPTSKIFLGLSFVQFISFAAVAVLIFIIARKVKLEKQHWRIFILTTLFWTAIKLTRSFRSVYPRAIGTDEMILAAVGIGTAYGFISMFIRLPFGILSDRLKSRLILVKGASIILATTAAFVAFASIKQDDQMLTTALTLSAYAMGIGASVWGMMNVMFAESLGKGKAILAISILSIPPLLADYIAAPFQQLANDGFIQGNPYAYGILWGAAAVFAVATLIYTRFVDENESEIGILTKEKLLNVLKSKKIWLLSLTGMVVLYVKFANSGTSFQAHFATLDKVNSLMVGYLDTMYSLPQLIAGVLAGLWLKKRIGSAWTAILGLVFMMAFSLLASTINSAPIVFTLYIINGLGYGLAYNVLLGMVVEGFDKGEKGWAMGIYQTFNAIGIYYGTKVGITNVTSFSYQDALWVNGLITMFAILPIFAIIKFTKAPSLKVN